MANFYLRHFELGNTNLFTSKKNKNREIRGKCQELCIFTELIVVEIRNLHSYLIRYLCLSLICQVSIKVSLSDKHNPNEEGPVSTS